MGWIAGLLVRVVIGDGGEGFFFVITTLDSS